MTDREFGTSRYTIETSERKSAMSYVCKTEITVMQVRRLLKQCI